MPATFEELWEQSHERVYRGLVKCGADPADAEDAVAQAGLQAWQAHERFDPAIASFRTWLGTIAFREWFRIIQKAKHYVPLDDEYPDEASYPAPFLELEDADPDQLRLSDLATILTETIQDRESAIVSLGQQPAETYGMITQELVRRARGGMPCTQAAIARAVGVDRSTVCRCFAHLRQELAGLKPV